MLEYLKMYALQNSEQHFFINCRGLIQYYVFLDTIKISAISFPPRNNVSISVIQQKKTYTNYIFN